MGEMMGGLKKKLGPGKILWLNKTHRRMPDLLIR